MDKLLGRGPGWVFLRLDDRPARWYKIETIDLLAQFDSPSDDVVDCTSTSPCQVGNEAAQSYSWDFF